MKQYGNKNKNDDTFLLDTNKMGPDHKRKKEILIISDFTHKVIYHFNKANFKQFIQVNENRFILKYFLEIAQIAYRANGHLDLNLKYYS